MNKKRVAALVRLLASDQNGEVLAAVAALKKLCNLNDLGNMIEGNLEEGQGKLSKEEMQRIYTAGFEAGWSDGLTEGLEKVKSDGKGRQTKGEVPPWEDVAGGDTFGAPTSDEQKVQYCQKHKDKLRKEKEREFVGHMVTWTTVRKRPMTEAQQKWLYDIYQRLRDMGLK